MRHGEYLQISVEDAVNFVAFEVQGAHIAFNVLIVSRIAKAQVAVLCIQSEQMLLDIGKVVRAQMANWHQHIVFVGDEVKRYTSESQ